MKRAFLIESGARGKILALGELYRFRELFAFLAWRDVKVRYKQTLLGVGWAVLQPLLNMLIFTLLFSRIAHVPTEGIPYPLFALSGLAPWMYAVNAVTFASNSLVADASLIRRVYFPKILLPLANAASGLVDFCVSCLLLAAALIFWQTAPGWPILCFPLWIALLFCAAAGPALLLAALNALYRDVKYIVPFFMQVWLFITPVAYPLSALPEKVQLFFALNPMVAVVELGRWMLLGLPPNEAACALSTLSAALLLAAGLLYFRKMERHFADVI
ncbi:MAG: ABC transporter permease [Chlamydiia bacterium]|nr:ABC transporter permease [Chlamydiia bacterium]